MWSLITDVMCFSPDVFAVDFILSRVSRCLLLLAFFKRCENPCIQLLGLLCSSPSVCCCWGSAVRWEALAVCASPTIHVWNSFRNRQKLKRCADLLRLRNGLCLHRNATNLLHYANNGRHSQFVDTIHCCSAVWWSGDFTQEQYSDPAALYTVN